MMAARFSPSGGSNGICVPGEAIPGLGKSLAARSMHQKERSPNILADDSGLWRFIKQTLKNACPDSM